MFHKRSLQWTGNPWSNLESSKKSTVQAPQNHDIIRAAIKKKQCIDVGKMEETMVFTSNMSVFSRTCTATTAADRPLCINKGHFWDTPCSNDQKWLKCVESKYQFPWKLCIQVMYPSRCRMNRMPQCDSIRWPMADQCGTANGADESFFLFSTIWWLGFKGAMLLNEELRSY